jgi:hypothetical protein
LPQAITNEGNEMSWLNLGHAMSRASLEVLTLIPAGIGVLSVWAALGRRHWFARALVLASTLVVLWLLRAYEPMLLLMTVAPTTAVVMVAIRRVLKTWMAISPTGDGDLATLPRVGLRITTIVLLAISLLWCTAVLAPSLAAAQPMADTYAASWYERWSFGAIGLALVVVTTIVLRLKRRCQAETDSSNHAPQEVGRIRFRLQDLLLVVVLVAMASAALAAALSKPLMLEWQGMLGTATCLIIVSVLAVCVVLFRRGWLVILIILLLSIGGSASLHAWVLSDWIGVQIVTDVSQSSDMLLHFSAAFIAYSIVVMTFTYLLLLANVLGGREIRVHRTQVTWTARGVLLLVGLAVYLPLAVVCVRMLSRSPMPSCAGPESNAYAQVIQAVEELHRLNPSESTAADIRDVERAPERAKEVEAVHRDLIDALGQVAFVPLDLACDGSEEYMETQLCVCQAIRSVARTWDAESQEALAARKFHRAGKFGLAGVRLGNAQQKGGLIVHSLLGIAVESKGVRQLRRARNDLSSTEVRLLLEALRSIDQEREPLEMTAARQVAWTDLAYTWRNSLSQEAPVVLASAGMYESEYPWLVTPGVQATEAAIQRRDAMLRLLITNLAVRLFQHENGRLPGSLEELQPAYLTNMPIDPYSNEPLIYRNSDKSYTLYSVWKDGNDDGGHFGTFSEIMGGRDYDLDLDFDARPPKLTPDGG